MYRLFQMQDSGNCYKIRLLMAQLQLACEFVHTDILQNESRTPEFLQKNPNGRVPTLQLPTGEYLAESNAILWFLADSTEYLPEDKFDRALVLQWMGFEQYSHEPFIATSRYWISIVQQEQTFAQQIQDKKAGGYGALDVMEKHLTDKDYFVANQYTIADICLFAYTHVAHEGKFNLEGYANIRAWISRIQSQPRHISITT